MEESGAQEDWRLVKLTRICLALPEVTRELMSRHARFYIRKKTFAYFLDDHHGDRIVGVSFKVLPGDNKTLVAADPWRFYMPAYIASKGWVGLRLDAGEIDWEEVHELMTHSYALVAPRRLAKALLTSDAETSGEI